MHYYLLRCTRSKSTLMQEFKDPLNYTYGVGSMVLMGHFFAEVRKCKYHIIFQDYKSDVICSQYSHLVIASRLQLKAVKSRKNSKHRQWKLSIEDHNSILDNMPLAHFIWLKNTSILTNFCSFVLGWVGGRGQMSFHLHVVGLVSREYIYNSWN